jgi:DNA-binding NarL/FixJ family response regulator
MTKPASDLILIVDDDAETRAMLARALEQAGFAAICAGDGETALAMVRRARPDLVVLDAVMDGLSGFETCRRLKAQVDNAHLPVIFVTGLTETEHVVEGLRAGGADYVTKPIVLEELCARIHVHLSAARLAHSAQTALDVAGRSLLATNSAGSLLWRTPQAAELLVSFAITGNQHPGGLAPDIAAAILALIAAGADLAQPPAKLELGERSLEIRYVGQSSPDELYFRLSEPSNESEAKILKSSLGLTSREAEILVWISRGKPNRDISDILNISPRTVNKHLEQVFAKLGVETRSAAAAIATRIVVART